MASSNPYAAGAPEHRQEDPEQFYRSSSPDNSSASPADSQAPIMASWSPQPPPSEFSPPPTIPEPSAPPTEQQQAQPYFPPPPTEQQQPQPYFPPPPTVPIAQNEYRSSIGVVNGEVGATVYPQNEKDETQYAIYPVAPLSAGLKTPGTSKEEQRVAELEEKARIEDRKDLAVKLKVRLAKVVLRSINCACSLVVLALVASTFAIFNATRHLAPRNNLPPWAVKTPQWPQITILVIACISLLLSLFIMYGYWKGGHSKAEKVALHATIFAGAVFIFTIALWSAGIGIMQGSRSDNNDQDIWGWACKDNTRRKLFQDTINYTLVCRQQDWVVVCAIIEISVETLAIAVYLFAFYRLFYTKKRLRKSLNVRDEARSSLWLAKLREQKESEEAANPVVDNETANNTAYNQLNSNTAYDNASDAEEGRAGMPVPILQPAPPGHGHKQSDASDMPLQPPAMPAIAAVRADVADGPRTGRSVSFVGPRTSISTPRSVSFQAPPPGSSGSTSSKGSNRSR